MIILGFMCFTIYTPGEVNFQGLCRLPGNIGIMTRLSSKRQQRLQNYSLSAPMEPLKLNFYHQKWASKHGLHKPRNAARSLMYRALRSLRGCSENCSQDLDSLSRNPSSFQVQWLFTALLQVPFSLTDTQLVHRRHLCSISALPKDTLTRRLQGQRTSCSTHPSSVRYVFNWISEPKHAFNMRFPPLFRSSGDAGRIFKETKTKAQLETCTPPKAQPAKRGQMRIFLASSRVHMCDCNDTMLYAPSHTCTPEPVHQGISCPQEHGMRMGLS